MGFYFTYLMLAIVLERNEMFGVMYCTRGCGLHIWDIMDLAFFWLFFSL
jgi:hypothetical protein